MGRKSSLLKTVSLDELKAMYDDGMSCEDIAARLGVANSTIYRHLQGHTTGRGGGGQISRRIPDVVIHPKAEQQAMHNMAVRNEANACLVVEDHTINLAGVVGKYAVYARQQKVLCEINGSVLELPFDALAGVADELKALARNTSGMTVGCEAW